MDAFNMKLRDLLDEAEKRICAPKKSSNDDVDVGFTCHQFGKLKQQMAELQRFKNRKKKQAASVADYIGASSE